MIAVVIVLALAVLGLGAWVIWLLSHPKEVRVAVPGPVQIKQVPGPVQIKQVPGPVQIKEVPGPVQIKQVPGPVQIKEVPGPVQIKTVEVLGPERIKEVHVTKYVRPDDVPPKAVIGSQLSDPRALPDAPGALPDSAVDGVRLGDLTVRAAAARGVSGRIDAGLRRQVAEISVLGMLVPPVLLSAVASGRHGAQYGQIGAVQATRSLHTKLANRAAELDRLWQQATVGDADAEQRLESLLHEVTASLIDPLTDAARRRDTTPDGVAVQLTCVLSRIGDTPLRQHLAFGVGPGPVLRARPGTDWLPVTDPTGRDSDYLPHDPKATWSQTLQTSPGDLVVLCTSSTARLLDRATDQLRADWATPPSLVGFLYQLGVVDNLLSDDRAAVCLWEGGARASR
jgi:hypothetical protein